MESTYKIIGGDGREYGPIPLDELKLWVRDGRVAPATQIWRSEIEAWVPARELPEVRPELGLSTGVADGGVDSAGSAGLWSRVGAILIDLFILEILARLALGSPPEGDMTILSDSKAYFAFVEKAGQWFYNFLLLAAVYTVAFNAVLSATPGKLSVGGKIVRLDGSPIGFSKALLRFPASLFSLFIFGFGYLLVALREDKRALHDLVAGTRVIYKR